MEDVRLPASVVAKSAMEKLEQGSHLMWLVLNADNLPAQTRLEHAVSMRTFCIHEQFELDKLIRHLEAKLEGWT